MANPLLFFAAFLSAVVMSQSLAHALELPGKMRLSREQYHAVQTIYYPGFTIAGFAEPLAILVAAAALFSVPVGSPVFWLIAAALLSLVVTHALFWLVVQPVNRQWLGSIKLSEAAGRFFRTGEGGGLAGSWTRLRNRWEDGHLARAITATAAFALLLVATSGAS